MLEEALAYAEAGWRVLPVHGIVEGRCTCGAAGCSNPGKHPAISKWQERATTDMAAVRRAWGAQPNLNIGLATGEGSGFFALDIDPRHQGDVSLAAWEAEYGALPLTLIARTGSGGSHIIFQHIPGLGNRANVSKGIDVRGDGGQIVAAPSLHWSGGRYQWVDPAVPIGVAPEWLKELLLPRTEVRHVATAGAVWRDLWCGGVEQGGRNDAVSRMAGHLFRARLDPYIVLDMMRTWNRDRVRPALSEDELVQTVNSVAGKELQRLQRRRKK